MRLNFFLFCGVSFLLGSAGTLSAAPMPPSSSTAPQFVSSFSVGSPTQIPGERLKPGSYTITVVDHLSDRIVLRVDSPGNKVHDTFLAVQNPSLRSGSPSGPISWKTGPNHDEALRGFAFPGGGVVEFVYPKAEAVAIAEKNDAEVPAIDPASEGRVAKNNNLSKEDMQMVTLWMLSPTTVGPKDASQPAIQAERYQAPEPAQTAPAQQVAQNEPPAPPPIRPVASVRRKPVLAKLPHTASSLPLVLLVGILSLLGAATLRIVQASTHAD